MSNKKYYKKPTGKKAVPPSSRPRVKDKTWFDYITRNLLALVLLTIFGMALLKKEGGYKWMWKDLISANMKVVYANRKFTFEQRNEYKYGFIYKFCEFIKENTSDTAVVLFPPDSVINSLDPRYRLSGLTDHKSTAYFLYPVIPVYEKIKDLNDKYKSIDYIAIVNYWGYEKLPYRVAQRQQFTVMPLKLSNITTP